jgi:non-specific serine/threonine protein kinase
MLDIARSAHLTEEDDEPFQLPVVLADRDDMRAALDWASDRDLELALELLVSLENFWNVHAPEEVLDRLDRMFAAGQVIPPGLRARALRLRGGALHVLTEYESCDEPYEESLALFRELGDERGVVSLTHRLANSALQRGEYDRASQLANDSLERSGGRFPFVDVPSYTLLGRISVETGDLEGGTQLLRQSETMAAEIRLDWWRAHVLLHLSLLALERGDLDDAQRDAEEALRLIRRDEGRGTALHPLTALARLALMQGDPRRAGLLWGASQAEYERAPNPWWQRRRAECAGPLLDEEDPGFMEGVEEGRQLDLWDAAAIALGEVEPQTEP